MFRLMHTRLTGRRLARPGDIMAKALEVYFEQIHRQPLWLFEAGPSPARDSSEELMCVLLALGLTSSPEEFTDVQLQSPEFYSDAARRATMLKIAGGTASLQTAQTLCLLAFFDIVCRSLFNSDTARHADIMPQPGLYR